MKYPWKQKILESKKIELLLVALLLLAAIVIRAYHFGAPPIGVHQDEAMAAVDAKALAGYGTGPYNAVTECGIRCILRRGVPAR